MRNRKQVTHHLESKILFHSINAVVIYSLCLYFIKSENVNKTSIMIFIGYTAFTLINKLDDGLIHYFVYIILGRRKCDMSTIKELFTKNNIPQYFLKNNEVDEYLNKNAEQAYKDGNLEGASILTLHRYKNEILELGCPAMEAWVHRDMIRRALAPENDKK